MRKVASTVVRFLGHPVVSAASTAYWIFTSIPAVLAFVTIVLSDALGEPVLLILALGLALIAIVLAGIGFLRQRPHKRPQGYSPEERREQLDNLFYPPRDDRLELGEQCANFAMKVRVFNEEQEWKREKAIARSTREIREADPDIDPHQARKDAKSHFERNVEAAYALALRDEALRLFDDAREQGAIAVRARRVAERPLAFEMWEVPNLFVALARRLGYEPINDSSRTLDPAPEDLRDQLDSLMREGIELVAELSVSVEPEQTNGGWKLEGGGAPDDWWEKADDFTKRIRELLLGHHPALLTDYRDGYNAHVKKEGKEEDEREPAPDERSTAEKLLGLANFERSGPRRVVEASLEGLAAARHRLGVPAQVSI